MEFVLKILDKDGKVLAESSGENGTYLVYEAQYCEGDQIFIKAESYPIHIVWQVDDALGAAQCFITKDVTYRIPFGEKKTVYSPKTFAGSKHHLFVRTADADELSIYRNLALNVADQHDVDGCYPHAKANVETRGESVFAARNAIDGNCANQSHGLWPFQSWGINRDPKACFRLDFGREVLIDRLKIWLRADFPHDAWWTEGTVTFSDGSQETLHFEKTSRGQVFFIAPRTVSWLTFDKLVKADDPSPFPALTQIEVYGKEMTK